MSLSVRVPPYVGGFLVKWILPFPKPPEDITKQWISHCCEVFKRVPHPQKAKKVASFFLMGQLVLMFFSVWSDMFLMDIAFWISSVAAWIAMGISLYALRRCAKFFKWLSALHESQALKTMLGIVTNLENNIEKMDEREREIMADFAYFFKCYKNMDMRPELYEPKGGKN